MVELQTSVDQLMELVQKEKKISLSEAAKRLKLPEKTIQNWVDFLVEEHVLGIEYKFTTPFIYVNSEERLEEVQDDEVEDLSLKDFRDVFYTYAQEKNMPQDRLPQLWKQHLRFTVEQQKQFFLQECDKHDLAEPEKLYERYLAEVLDGA